MYNYDEFRKWAKFIIGESFDDKWSYYQTLLKVSDKIKESIDSPSSSGTDTPSATSGEDGDIYVQTDANGIVGVWYKVNEEWKVSPVGTIVVANGSGEATATLQTIEVDGVTYAIPSPTSVSVDALVESGVKIATITINGSSVDLYAPKSGVAVSHINDSYATIDTEGE